MNAITQSVNRGKFLIKIKITKEGREIYNNKKYKKYRGKNDNEAPVHLPLPPTFCIETVVIITHFIAFVTNLQLT